jgi:Cu/Ag efflux protein CusF
MPPFVIDCSVRAIASWGQRGKLPHYRSGVRFLYWLWKETIMRRLHRLIVVLGLAVLIAAACLGQAPGGKKSFHFHGKVESVSPDGVTVAGDNVEGWMPAMTMKYKVDDPKILKTVKAGDEITATVYEGDFSLHKVQVAGKSAK